MFFRSAVSLMIAVASLSSMLATASEAGRSQADMIVERSKQLGTNIPQNEDARAVLVGDPDATLMFPGFLIGLEKAPIDAVGCPPNRGLNVEAGDPDVKNHLNQTLNFVYVDNGKESLKIADPMCLFVSHIAEFTRDDDDTAAFQPKIAYSAYRDDLLPSTKDAFGGGRNAVLVLRARLRTVAAARAARGKPVTHFIVLAMGWHTNQVETLKAMNQIDSSIRAAAKQDGTPYSPLMLGISWPSFSPEIAMEAGKTIGLVVDIQKAVIPPFVPRELVDGLDQTADFLKGVFKNDVVADACGRLGYPVLAKNADEVGIVWSSTLVNQVLMPLREEIAPAPAVIVIGHSFGARIATWSGFSGPLLPAVEGVPAGNGPDVIIGLQGDFPAARFDKKAASFLDWRPYHEGAPFASFREKRTKFVYTVSSNDVAVQVARPVDTMIGDTMAFRDDRRFTDDLFDRRDVEGRQVGALQLVPDAPPVDRKVLLVDASSIIKSHNDVLNRQAGWLVWKFIRSVK